MSHQQDPVLEGLVPALDLALGLGMARCATDMLHALIIEPFGQVAIGSEGGLPLPSAHTTVRTVPYTAVQVLRCRSRS